jgi:sortase A
MSQTTEPRSAAHRNDGDGTDWRSRMPRLRKPTVTRRAPSVRQSIAAWMMGALGALLLWFLLYAFALSALQASHNQHVLYSQFREQLSAATAPTGGYIKPDSPVALLTFPAAGIHEAVVVEGTASQDLMKGPGHRRDTPLPGQIGTSYVFGRANLFGGPFGDIAKAKVGDPITVVTAQGSFTYKVVAVRFKGDPVAPALASGSGRLTLATSDGNAWSPSSAMYVDADAQNVVTGSAEGRPTEVPQAEQAMHGDIGALLPLVLWIPVVLIAVLAVVWAYDRWGKWQTWLLGIPVIVAALWGASEVAVQLLPNLT